MYKQFIKNNYEILQEIINCLKVGVYITDGKGDTLFLNDESCRTGSLTRKQVLGRNMRELEEMGFISDSVTLKVLKSGNEEAIVQTLGDGGKVYVNGKPLYNNNGKIELVVCTEHETNGPLILREDIESLVKQKEEDEIKVFKAPDGETAYMIAEDEESRLLREKALRIARLDTTVLLTGESGTGKEVLANFIYQNSSRVGKPFIKVNCAAIPEQLMESELFGYERGSFTGADANGKIGLFEKANGGTLVLDEIGEMPVYLQSKLLRVLQEREIMRVGGSETIPLDIRLIAVTNRDLKKAIEAGLFREDLYYRLNIMNLELLPLKGRKNDIRALTLYFIRQFNKEYKMDKSITEEAIQSLQAFTWPGNVRELKNVIENIMISFDGNTITKFQVDYTIGFPLAATGIEIPETNDKSLDELLEDYEKHILESMMEKYKKASTVSRVLKINKSTLSRRLKKYDIL